MHRIMVLNRQGMQYRIYKEEPNNFSVDGDGMCYGCRYVSVVRVRHRNVLSHVPSCPVSRVPSHVRMWNLDLGPQ